MSPIPCPSCGSALPAQPLACPACQLPLTGPAAARLWQVDQAITALRTEREALLGTLRGAGDHGPPQELGPTRPTRPTRPSLRGATIPSATIQSVPAVPKQRWTTQQTLLAVGVLLVLVAAAIALAYAWFVIGPYGQLAIMGGLTALAAVGAMVLSRRRLASTAEAFALLAGGLMLLDASAARRFGLADLDRLDGRTYAVLSGLALALVLATLHRRDPRVAGFAVLSLTAASVAWAGVTRYGGDSPAANAGLALVGAAVFGALRVVLPPGLGLVRRAATGPAAGWAAVSLLVASAGALDAYEPATSGGAGLSGTLDADGVGCVAILGLLTAAGALVVRHVVGVRAMRLRSRAAVRADWFARPASGDWRALGVVALAASAAAPTGIATLALQLGAPGTALLSCVVAVVATVLVAARPLGRGLGELWALSESGLALAVLVGIAVVQGSEAAIVVTLTAASLAGATTAVVRRPWRSGASGGAALAAAGAIGVGGAMVSPSMQTVALALTLLVLATAALARPGEPEEGPLGAVAATAGLGSLALALAHGLPDGVVIVSLVALALAAAAVAVVRISLRTVACAVAAVTGTWALWLLGALASAATQLTVVSIAAATLAGLAAWRRGRAEEPVFAAAAWLTALLSVGTATARDWPHAAAALAAAYGLLAVGYAALPHRRAVASLAVAGLTAAVWIEVDHAGTETVEAYTLPLAALLLAAGLWSRRELGRRSWLIAGPGLAVGLAPSALLTIGDENLARPLATVVLASVVLAVGAGRRWQACVVLGAAAAATVALAELGPVTLHAPRSVTLGAAGIVLLALGARYEQRRANARQAMSWLASMS